MPEGDTLHRIARALRPDLQGQVLRAVTLQRMPELAGRLVGERVAAVDAVGKHLVITLEGGLALRTHLGMKGSWHRYRPGEAWQRPARQASVMLSTDERVLVCFRARDVEVLRVADADRGVLGQLGPDLLAPPLDLGAIVARARALGPSRPVAEVLLDQRVAAGIGNVYKSELCFLEQVDPRRPLDRLDDDAVARLYGRAAELMAANVAAGGARVTTRDDGRAPPGGRLWVYGRARRPCRRCGEPIACERQGDHARATWWCPRCQR